MSLQDIIVSKCNLVDYVSQYTDLRQRGETWRGCCPIHGGKNETSFVVFKTGFYYCHACGSCGNVINFFADKEGVSYNAALERLASELNIDVSNYKDYSDSKTLVQGNERYMLMTKRQIELAMDYLTKDRGFTRQTIDEFNLGWYDGGITIPIYDYNGRMVAFAKRNFDQLPKYINSKNNILYDKSATLFNLDKARRMIKDENSIYVVEGYMDAISGQQLGLPTVATCTNDVYREQVELLNRFLNKNTTVIYCPDNDEEGHKRIVKIRNHFQDIAPRLNVRVLCLEKDCGIKDMNDMLVKGIDPRSLPTEHIDSYVLGYLLTSCSSREEEYAKAEEFMESVKNPMIKLDLIRLLSTLWDKPEESLRKHFDATGSTKDDMLSEFANVEDCINDLRTVYTSGGFKTGFPRIDNSLRRIRKKQVVVLGAYSYSGKTDLAIEMMLNAISLNKMRVLFFSLEMPKGQLIERAIAKVMGVPASDVELMIESGDEVVIKVREILDKYLIVIDSNNLSMQDINARIKLANSRNVLDGPIDLVIVDYFTYIKGVNTFEGASAAALSMKGIAKDNDIIFVMLSQLNRSGSNFDEPSMRQLRMTGDLEASADIILLLWRPGLNPELSLEESERLKYQSMVKLEKARDGIYGAVRFEFAYNPKTSRLVETA